MNPSVPSWLLAWQTKLGASLIETHISWLLLSPTEAFKLKRPLVLPFLDYGSPEKRRYCCEEELRLNRRYAPELYLGLTKVPGTDETAVRMRRFDERCRLDHLCARGEFQTAQLTELAELIARFHRQADIAPAESRFGDSASIIGPARDNFSDLHAQLCSSASNQQMLGPLSDWTEQEFTRLLPIFIARKQAGCIRECHGDLHLGNLVLLDRKIVPFDCIEFNEDLRWIDVASEIAFTYIDLIKHDQPGLALWWLNEWLSVTGDYDALPVIRFYAVYRALVRAKVAGLREDSIEQQRYLALASSLIAPPKPQLFITFGLSGSGKSRASRQRLLGDVTASTLRLRSDVERKRLFGLSAKDQSASGLSAGIYSSSATQATLDRLERLAADALSAGWSVIVDATFLRHADRQRFQQLADALHVEFFILAREAPPETLRARIQQRIAKGKDASEATLEVLDQQLRSVEPLTEAERMKVLDSPQD